MVGSSPSSVKLGTADIPSCTNTLHCEGAKYFRDGATALSNLGLAGEELVEVDGFKYLVLL